MDWRYGRVGGAAEWLLAGLMWLWLDVPYLWRLGVVACKKETPFALQAATAARTPHLLVRPLVSVWWLAHFGAGVRFAAEVHHGLDPIEFSLVACYGFAANGFLMLGTCAATPSEKIRSTVWRLRGLTDVGLAFVGSGVWHWARTKIHS